MKKCIIFCLLISLFVFFFAACEEEPAAELTQAIVTLSLEESSPQTSIIVSWTASNDADCYYITREMIRDGVTETKTFSIYDSETLWLIDDTCESNTEYSYTVTAYAAWSVGFALSDSATLDSEKKSIRTADDPKVILDYPKNVTVTFDENLQYALNITWDPVEGADYYEIYYAARSNNYCNEEFEKAGSTDQTNYIQKYLRNNSGYSFMVKAFAGDNYSLFSTKASGEVTTVINLTKDKALLLENNVNGQFYALYDSLWFKCEPEIGLVKFTLSYQDLTAALSIFDETGNVLASGLALFTAKGLEDSNISASSDEDKIIIVRNINNDLNEFESGKTYYLRIKTKQHLKYSICVE